MSTENSYTRLLAEARSGSRAGMGELAVVVWERLHPFVLRVTLNPDLTEDVLQETILALLSGLDDLRDPSRFWPWMYRIAWSKIQNHVRSRRVRSSAEASFLRAQADPDGTRGDGDSPLDVQVRREMQQQVSSAVGRLSPSHREVLRQHYYGQMEYAEIAQETQVDAARIRIRSFRAKKSLRSRLACCL
jgi:RNA polymerase sigma-70 factor, ECF subfamily